MSNIDKKLSLKEVVGRKVVCFLTFVSPTLSSKVIYRIHTHKKLDLKNPKLFNEKLMYLKLHDYKNNPLVIECSDKLKVRDYVTKCGLGHLLNKVYGVYDDARDIDFDSLPSKFALKCNHGCGFNIICTDKDKLDKEKTIKTLNKWKKTKFGYNTCEPHYFKIKPRIYAEEYIASNDGIMPNDYKIYCFNGEPKIVLVCSEREHDLKLTFFDLEWHELNYGTARFKTKKKIKKPQNLDKRIEYAKILSKPFKFVRVDFYDNFDKVLFGELTFTPARCSAEYYNDKGSIELGNMLSLKEEDK